MRRHHTHYFFFFFNDTATTEIYTLSLHDALPICVAHELCLTGEMITAEEAQRIGLVIHIQEPAELLPAAEAMAKKIIANAPLAVKYAMEAIERGVEMPQEEGLFLEATLFGLACATEDMREGTKAFLEKRPAQFKGK